jgi:hypothetical protein
VTSPTRARRPVLHVPVGLAGTHACRHQARLGRLGLGSSFAEVLASVIGLEDGDWDALTAYRLLSAPPDIRVVAALAAWGRAKDEGRPPVFVSCLEVLDAPDVCSAGRWLSPYGLEKHVARISL